MQIIIKNESFVNT